MCYLCITSCGCFDLFDQKNILLFDDIYARHSPGIDGYGIFKKVRSHGYIPIIPPSVVSISFNEKLKLAILTRVSTINETDTSYLKLAFYNYPTEYIGDTKIDTISGYTFRSLFKTIRNKIILLK